MQVQERLFTAEDLWAMPDDGKIYELHNGVLVEMPGSGKPQTRLAAWIIHLITVFIMEHDLGGAVSSADGTFVLSQFNTRIPDVSYVTAESDRLQLSQTGYFQGAPDLAVEVVSPSNSPLEMQQRAGMYLGAGTRLVWIVNPTLLTVDIYKADGQRVVLGGEGVLTSEPVLPGFQVALKVLFNPFTRVD